MIKRFYRALSSYHKPHTWLSFYFCVRVPIGIIASAINVWSYFEYGLYDEGIIQAIISALIVIMFLLIMARKKFSYTAMLIALFIESLGFTLNGRGTDEFLLYISVSVVYLFLNVYYFSGRQDFFVPYEIIHEHENIESNEERAVDSQKRKRYCKFCGNEIDPITKKCAGCGKQYFNFKKMIKCIVPVILIISLICNVILSVMLYQNHQQIIELKDELQEQYEKAEDNEEKAQYLDEHVVFTTASGAAYHSYGCQYIQGRYKFVWFIEEAIREGYTPCSVCQKNSSFVY